MCDHLRTWVFVFLFLSAKTFAAAEGALSSNEANGFIFFEGKVSFQRHSTVVPLTVCSGDLPCLQPQPYWTVMVNTKKVHYELNQTFHLGQSRTPEFIEMNGMEIRPGIEIRVEGKVEPVSEDYSIVSDVRRIDLVQSSYERVRSGLLLPMDIVSPLNSAWSCQGQQLLGSEVQAQVWYGSGHSRGGAEGFRMLLKARHEDGTFREILRSDDVGAVTENKDLLYRANAMESSAELQIHQVDGSVFEFPSTLKMRKLHRLSRIRWGADTDTEGSEVSSIVSLKCRSMDHF